MLNSCLALRVMAIGKRIEYYRKVLGWQMKDLAARADVEVGTINALEKRDSKKSEAFPAIAKAFGLTVEELADESRDYDVSERIRQPNAAAIESRAPYSASTIGASSKLNRLSDLALSLALHFDTRTKGLDKNAATEVFAFAITAIATAVHGPAVLAQSQKTETSSEAAALPSLRPNPERPASRYPKKSHE